ncbi:MAG: ABC transporter ATP-binding protein [Bacteroidales bacterium]|nr:ABC transporter ATP-binding protein [Bacteroidales bacterium]
MIVIENLSRIYRKGSNEVAALQDLNFRVQQGSFVSVIGRSGSGKSTLLNLIGGLDRSDEGSLFFKEKDVMQMSRRELALHRRFSVGMIFQSFNLIHSRTARENIELALAFGGKSRRERKKQAMQLLEAVGLEDRADHQPTELSGGESQRVAIARAMANKPSVLLADEPTGNLDSATSGEIIELLQNLNKQEGVTILMVTHEEDTAHAVSDHLLRLSDGKMLEERRISQ